MEYISLCHIVHLKARKQVKSNQIGADKEEVDGRVR